MMIPPLMLDRSSGEPLTTQLADQLREAIRQGRIPVGARLPSSRRLSDQLYVGRNTVVRAYETLSIEGFVQTRSASGVFAASPQAVALPHPLVGRGGLPLADLSQSMPVPRDVPRAPRLAMPNRHRLQFDLPPARPRASLFPVKAWRRLVQANLAYGGSAGLTHYGDPCGLPALRAAIAAHLAFSRGMVVDPAQVCIVSGIQQGLSIVARLFIAPGDAALVEDPCYQGAAAAFEAAGACLQAIPVDEGGLMVTALPPERASVLYLTASHQYPTGHALTLQRRHALIGWARRTGCYLVDDDYDGDFQYEGSPLPALASLGPDCCIHLGSFSASLGAGLRLGYIVVPAPLIDPVRETKSLLDNGSPWLDQATLAEFIRSGSFAAHVTRCRAEYRESRDALVNSLQRHFGEVRISGERSGLHLFWQLPAGVPGALRMEDLARQARLGVCSFASANVRWTDAGAALARCGMVLGYATMKPRQIEQAIARLSDVVDDTLDNQPGFVDELLSQQPPLQASQAPEPRRRRGARPALSFLHQPALRTVRVRHAHLDHESSQPEDQAVRVIKGIYRYPIKGLSPQPLHGITLEAGQPFPFDRVFAMARPGAPVDRGDPKWAKKGLFLMLMLDDAMARVQTHLDVQTLHLEIMQNGARVLNADLDTAAGRASVEAYFHGLVSRLAGPPQLVRSTEGHFMDKPDNVISLINLATVRSLEQKWGRVVDPLRFRANFYFEGLQPWEEFDWVGSDIQLGDALFRVDRRNGRCGATNVNPVTGQRDMDIPLALRNDFGHKDVGIYLLVRKPGKVVVGDSVVVPQFAVNEAAAPPSPAAVMPGAVLPGARRYICRGCYFIYDEAAGLPQSSVLPGTAFSGLSGLWRCPDCGTEKTNFRAYSGETAGRPS